MLTTALLHSLLVVSCCDAPAPTPAASPAPQAADSPAVPAILARVEYERTEFSGSAGPWHQVSAAAAVRFTDGMVELSARHVDRRVATDVGLALSAWLPTWTGAYANLRIHAAPDATVIPEYGGAVELYQVVAPHWEVSALAREDRYPERVTVLGGSVAHIRGPWAARGRVSAATVAGEWAPFYTAQIRRSLRDPDSHIQLWGGAGDEVVEIIAPGDPRRVEPDIRSAYTAGVAAQLLASRHVGGRLGLAYNHYDDLQDRVRGSVGLVVRW